MLMMLGLLARTAGKVPTDAHDAGPFGPKRLERSQLMLMMLDLLARKGWKSPNRCS